LRQVGVFLRVLQFLPPALVVVNSTTIRSRPRYPLEYITLVDFGYTV
jgi:hypothetical protein